MAADDLTDDRYRDEPPDDLYPDEPPIKLTSDDRNWAMFCHLSAIATGTLLGLPFLGPLILWLMKKDQSKFIDFHGKEALNFQLNMLIYLLICGALVCVVVGIVLLPVVGVYALVMAIVAGVKANNGEYYRYPAIIRIIT
jgi:uncharacterized Tic20 family protein